MENQFEMVFAIVNSGYTEEVMDAVKACGATGGTISEKELVMIIISKEIKENVLKTIYEKVGLDTPGQGIAFTVPVDDVVGINKNIGQNNK